MKPTNPMTQLQQWKANNSKKLVSDGGVSANGVHPNSLKIEPVKSAVKNANQTNFGLVKNTQGNEHREAKNKYQGKHYHSIR